MMNILSKTIAGRTVTLATKYAPRALAATAPQIQPLAASRLASSSSEKVPEEDYIDGHLLTDHLEYLDDMIDKTLKIESNMERLRQTYAEKRKAYNGSASVEEMERLFLQAEEQKQLISAQVSSLKTTLLSVKSNGYAVDAPDGTSDELEQLYRDEANEVLNESGKK